MTKIKIIILTIIGSFLISGNIYASEMTYKYTSQRRNDTFSIYKDENLYTNIELPHMNFNDLGIERNGTVTDDIIDKVKNTYIDLYVSKINEVLDTTKYVSSSRNSRTLKSFLPEGNNKPSLVSESRGAHYVRESILAYNCNILKQKWESCKNNYDYQEHESFKNSNTVISVKAYFAETDVKQMEELYNMYADTYNSSISTGVLNKIKKISGSENASQDITNNTSGALENSTSTTDYTAAGTGNWWTDAQSFFNKAKESDSSSATNELVNELSGWIFEIGNMIFMVVTSILGVKYIFGSAEGKARIKDSLITLIVAALFFYGWEAIKNLLDIEGLLSSGTMVDTASKIYNTVLFVVNLLAIGGIIWIGVKYMMSSAEGKSQIKTSWGPFILGIVMVYATLKFLTTVITVLLGA